MVRESLVLASGSPQRRAILEQLGIEFRVEVPGVEEIADGSPREVVLENARRKARAVAGEEGRPGECSALVLGVDTLVALDGRIYGQPADEQAARETLNALGGRTHTVISGLVLASQSSEHSGIEETAVTFRDLDADAIHWYLATAEWRGRAGAYAIQERGAALVRRIEGDYLNVVGLPLGLLLDLATS